MIYLLIDTCDSNYMVSIIKNHEVLFLFQSDNTKELSTKLLLTIEDAFHSTELNIRDVDKIFVTTGPGSFTGIRVGTTVAKTIGFALNKKILSLSKLELLATTPFETDYIVPYIDARRDFVYAGVYDQKLNVILADQYISLDELKKQLVGKSVTFVSTKDLVSETMEPNENVLKIICKHEEDTFCDAHKIVPNYLKKTEAEEKHDQGNS